MTDLLQNAATIEALAKLSSAFFILAGLAWAFLKWVVPFFGNINRSWNELHDIVKELKPNGGSSIKDAVVRLDKAVAQLVTNTEIISSKQWALVATQPSPVFETDNEGRCIRANTSYMNLAERDFEQLKGYGWENFLHSEDRELVSDEWQEAVRKRRAFDLRYRVVGAVTKKTFIVQCFASPYFDHNGKVLGWLGRFASVEEYKQN